MSKANKQPTPETKPRTAAQSTAPETATDTAAGPDAEKAAETAEPAPETAEAETPGAAENPDADAAPEPSLPALKEQLAAAQTEAAEYKDRLLRTVAEYDNFRKRSAREQDAAFNNGVSFAVGQILNILDTLEMAARAETADENYKKGVVMTLDKAAAALAALKVEEIPAEGQPFDPNLHAAVGQAPAGEGVASGSIVQVYQKGYRLGDKVIRHAAVVVAE